MVTIRFQSSGRQPGGMDKFTLHPGGTLTIGRAPENDVVLPDPDRVVSSRHCVIEDHGGNVIIVDFSTNGTFQNYGSEPLGQVPTPLNHGDVLSIGPYELIVDIPQHAPGDPFANLPDPVGEGPISHGDAVKPGIGGSLLDEPDSAGGDFLDDMLGPAPTPGARPVVSEASAVDKAPDLLGADDLLAPLGEENGPPPYSEQNHSASPSDAFQAPSAKASVIPDDFDEFLGPMSPPGQSGSAPDPFGTPVAPVAEPADEPPLQPQPRKPVEAPTAEDPLDDLLATGAPPVPEDQAAASPATPLPNPPPTTAAAPAPHVASPPRDGAGGSDAAARAFLDALGVDDLRVDDEKLHETMAKLGRVMAATLTGLREVLMTRTEVKREFRMSQTMIGRGGNNPLKFSVSPEQAIEAMVKPHAKGYLPAEDAAHQALKDIKAHQVATITGMQAALKSLLERLDPKKLEDALASKGGGGMFKGKKARYWELYEEMYTQISHEAEENFHDVFGDAFAQAYQDQMKKL